MAMKRYLKVVHAGRKYTDPQTGEEKTVWTECGGILKDDESGGMSMHLDYLPVGAAADGKPGYWFRLFDFSKKGTNGGSAKGAPAPSPATEDDDDSIPF